MKNSLTKGEVDRMYRAILGQLPRTVEAEVAEPLTAALESLRQVKINDDVGFSAAAAELAHTAVASPRAMTVVARLLENLPRETSFYDQVRQGTARALGLLADRLGDVSQIAANALAAHLGDPPGGEATIALQRLIPVDPCAVQEAIYRAISRFPWLWECVYLLLSQMPPAQVDVGRWLECRHPAARAVGIVHLGRTRPTSGLMQQMLRAAIADRSYIVRCSAVLAVVRAPINTVGRDVLASALYDRHPHVLAAWYANVCQGRDARSAQRPGKGSGPLPTSRRFR